MIRLSQMYRAGHPGVVRKSRISHQRKVAERYVKSDMRGSFTTVLFPQVMATGVKNLQLDNGISRELLNPDGQIRHKRTYLPEITLIFLAGDRTHHHSPTCQSALAPR